MSTSRCWWPTRARTRRSSRSPQVATPRPSASSMPSSSTTPSAKLPIASRCGSANATGDEDRVIAAYRHCRTCPRGARDDAVEHDAAAAGDAAALTPS